jgi:hypothetical protein
MTRGVPHVCNDVALDLLIFCMHDYAQEPGPDDPAGPGAVDPSLNVSPYDA